MKKLLMVIALSVLAIGSTAQADENGNWRQWEIAYYGCHFDAKTDQDHIFCNEGFLEHKDYLIEEGKTDLQKDDETFLVYIKDYQKFATML